MSKLSKIFGVVFIFVGLGSLMISSHMTKFQGGRDPAAVRSVYDFTHLHGVSLEKAVKERLITGLETFHNDEDLGIGFGHFSFSTSSGERMWGCRAYDRIQIIFEAEGMAVSGEKPLMTIEGKCESSHELGKIDPLWIPVSKVFSERPSDGEFTDHVKGTRLLFQNVADHWNRDWVLKSVKFIGDRSQIQIDNYELGRIIGRPYTIQLEHGTR